MRWRLRLFWDRADNAALVFALFFSLVVGALAYGFIAASNHREAQRASLREFHARSLECLARNVYYEARGESRAGQYAVAEVTMNRKASPFYPKTVCDVVYQREAFSWTGIRALQEPAGEAWQHSLKVAEEVYYHRRTPTLHGNVTHFHATYVQPDWSKEKERVARIGRHVFYR